MLLILPYCLEHIFDVARLFLKEVKRSIAMMSNSRNSSTPLYVLFDLREMIQVVEQGCTLAI